jgi:acetyltransferase-like isoleucine patch superfamily enzyme
MQIIIPETALVDPRVQLGPDSIIGDYVVLGRDPAGSDPATLEVGREARIRSFTVIYSDNRIGDRFQTGHGVMVREGNEIGSDVSIGTHSIVEHHVVIGDHVRIHSNAFIPEYTVLEEGAWIGPSVTLTNARYPMSRDAKANLAGPVVGRGARIGANATVLPGVVVGPGALVGAGSVVVRDVPAGAVVVGNPGRVVRLVAEIEAYRKE